MEPPQRVGSDGCLHDAAHVYRRFVEHNLRSLQRLACVGIHHAAFENVGLRGNYIQNEGEDEGDDFFHIALFITCQKKFAC